MKPHLLTLLMAAGILSAASSAQGAVYTQNFDSYANGTTNLGDGTVIASVAAGAASVQGGALVLTRDGVQSENATFKIPGFAGASNGWTAEFDVTIVDADAGDPPADGVSFNWGNFALDASLSGNAAEHGWTPSFNHLAFQVDTYLNGNGDNGVRIAAYPAGSEFIHAQTVGNILNDNTTVTGHVVVSWNPVDGASMTTTGFVTNANFSNVPIPGLVASDSNVFAFASRTGGAHETVRVDNFVLSATPGVGISTPSLAISELVVDNTKHEDEHCQTPGWVEIYNGTPAAISLNGWSLTDDAGMPGKWVFPNGYSVASYTHLLVYFGHGTPVPAAPDTRLHASFQPLKAGGYLGLYQGATEVDALNTYPAQFEDVAYGRLGAGWTLGFLETPTPGARNAGTQSPGGLSQGEVAFDQAGGLITGPVALTLSIAPLPALQPAAGSVIRYTTNNTAPSPSSTAYTGPINITTSSIVRARVFEPGHLPGDTTTRGYIFLDPNVANYRGTGGFNSNLPVIVFDSFGNNIDGAGGASGLRQFQASYSVVVAPDAARGNRTILDAMANIDFQGRCGTHLRGETSASFPQKPYAWELWDNKDGDKDASILGMPADSDWVLISNYNDKSLMRNLLPFQTLRDANGPGASGRTMYVEVFFNQAANSNLGWDDYRGVYVLTEKIKRANDRVDIAKLDPCEGVFTNNPAVDDAAAISGGYIIRRDKASPEPKFTTTNWEMQIVEPPVPSVAQVSYIQNYMNRFEATLNTPTDPVNNFYRYADVDSFIYNAWWVEIFKQIDGYRLSTYFYKDRGGKVRAHPLWDYNLSGGNGNYNGGMDPTGWYFNNGGGGIEYTYWQKMFAHSATNLRRWEIYWKNRAGIFENNTILSRMDSLEAQLRDNLPGTSDIWNGVGTAWANGTGDAGQFGDVPQTSGPRFPNNTPNVESPAGRHNARWQRIGMGNWPNADGFAARNRWSSPMTAATALALTGTAANEYGLETVTSDTAHARAWLIKRLAWIDNAFLSGNTILRPPVLTSQGGNVPAGFSLGISPYTGTAPASALYGLSGTLNYANGPIYYTTDGSDPTGVVAPGVTINIISDTHAIHATVPQSAAANADSFGVNWLHPDFNAASPPAGVTWYSGINGVGYDDLRTSGVDFSPHINLFWNTAAFPVAGRPTMRATASPPGNMTSYIRYPFTLTAGDLTNLSGLKLFAKCDDGCIAWLNGVRIGELFGQVSPVWNSGTAGGGGISDAAAIVYQEVPALNTAAAIAALRVGVNVLAVQGMNSSVNSNDFLQRYKLDFVTGSSLSTNATLYSGPITINSPVTIRARQFNTATGAWTPSSEATFTVDTVPASAANLVVSEILYSPVNPSPAEITAGFNSANMFEYAEILNISNTTVDLAGVEFTSGITFTWPTADPALRVLAPGGRVLIVGNLAAFTMRYAPGPSVKIAGVFSGNISNGGEQIVVTGTGGVIKDFIYDDVAPWPLEPDTLGYSLVLNHPRSNPNHSLPGSWRSSLEAGGTPGAVPGASGPTGSGAAALADTDGDGISDLVEYATGTLGNNGASQHWPTTGSMTAIVPPSLVPADYLTFSYTRSRSADDFTFEPEVSTALTGWQPLGTLFTFAGQSNNPDGTASLTWRSTAPASTLPPRIFLQVRAGIAP